MQFRIPLKGNKQLHILTSKGLYNILLYNKITPLNCKRYWFEMFPDIKEVWENVFVINTCNSFIPRNIIDFNWKLIHGVINTESRLKRMNLSNGKCKICYGDENIVHLLVECRDVKDIWNMFQSILKKSVFNELEICTQHKLIGMLDETNEDYLIVNMIFSIVRWILWKRRNIAKFENKILTYYELKSFVISNISVHIDTLLKSKGIKCSCKNKLQKVLDSMKEYKQ